jgi:DNA-binding XRE family transcriptional regulator
MNRTKIKAARIEAGYNQLEMAALMGITISTYSLKENRKNRRQFNETEINILLKETGKTYEELFLT